MEKYPRSRRPIFALVTTAGFLPAPTVDGRNPKQPAGMYKTFVNNGDKLPTSTVAGFLPSTV